MRRPRKPSGDTQSMLRMAVKRRVFPHVVLAGLSYSVCAWGQISLVHVTSCGPGAFPGTVCTIPATGSGHLIVVGWASTFGTAPVIASVTDNMGNIYREAGNARAVDTSANEMVDIWYAKKSIPGVTTLTITPNPAGNAGAGMIWEFSNVDTVSPLDQTAVLSSQPATTTPYGASIATTQPTEVILSLITPAAPISGLYGGNPFTSDSLVYGVGWAHLITSSAGTYAAQWNTTSGTYASSSVSFKAAGSISACDLNADGAVNILDVQLAADMNAGSTPCTAPGGYCNSAFYTALVTAALPGGACVVTALEATPASVNLGNVAVGGSGSQTVALSLTGAGSATISQVSVTGAGFSISGLTLPQTMTAGQSTSFNVVFAPSVAAAASGSITLSSNALDASLTIPLSGTGVTPVSHSVSLNWTASTSPNIVGYNVYRGTVSGGPYTKLDSSLITGTTYTDTAVAAGQTYYYVATAVNSSNQESAYSNQASATVPTP
jgi:hypothetical protein